MKKIVLLVLVSIISACSQPEIINTPEALDEITSGRSFEIKTNVCGCFGCGDINYTVRKKGEILVSINESIGDRYEVSIDSLSSLTELVKPLIGTKTDDKFCTSTNNCDYVIIGNKEMAVSVEDKCCHRWNKIHRILGTSQF